MKSGRDRNQLWTASMVDSLFVSFSIRSFFFQVEVTGENSYLLLLEA
jgi:hypothetical protein